MGILRVIVETNFVFMKNNPLTNKQFQEILKQFPEDAIICIEYCNANNPKYIKELNIINID